jgi:hypothetical protein
MHFTTPNGWLSAPGQASPPPVSQWDSQTSARSVTDQSPRPPAAALTGYGVVLGNAQRRQQGQSAWHKSITLTIHTLNSKAPCRQTAFSIRASRPFEPAWSQALQVGQASDSYRRRPATQRTHICLNACPRLLALLRSPARSCSGVTHRPCSSCPVAWLAP